ncbi:MAG: hypothetical protein MOP50_215, partial [Nitrososphaera sp.]|nr:hypothetical protein [Nitrososphaera sp.]
MNYFNIQYSYYCYFIENVNNGKMSINKDKKERKRRV